MAFGVPIAIAFLVGLLFGSFLNVCIVRLPRRESVVRPRSHCRTCGRALRAYENIPVLSFLFLRGRCRGCRERISAAYPAVELAVGLWFAWCAWNFGRSLAIAPDSLAQAIVALIANAALGFLLIGLAVTDWQTQTLPDAFTISGIALGFFLVCVDAIFLPRGVGDIHLHRSMRMSSPGSMVERGDVFLTGPEHTVFGRLLAVCAAALILWLVREAYRVLRGRHGMGLGDVKLLAMLAALLGFWPAILALFLGVVACGLFASVLLAARRAHLATRLPLGTFLALGGLVAVLVGGPLLAWYGSLL